MPGWRRFRKVVRRFSEGVYDVAFFVVRCERPKLRPWMVRVFGAEFADDKPESRALASTFWIQHPRGNAVVMWFKASMTLKDSTWQAVLAHECLHATGYVLGSRGVRPSFDDDEPQAYYLSHLYREAAKRLR